MSDNSDNVEIIEAQDWDEDEDCRPVKKDTSKDFLGKAEDRFKLPKVKHPDPRLAAQIRLMRGYGMSIQEIMTLTQITQFIFYKYYQKEYEEGGAFMKAKLVKTAYQMAIDDRNPAMVIFLLKTKYGYRETDRHEVVVSQDGEKPIKQMSDAELNDAIKRLEYKKQIEQENEQGNT